MEWSTELRVFGVACTALLALLLWQAARPRRGPRWRWLPATLAGLSAATFLWALNRWDLSSVHLRPVYPVLYAIALVVGLRRTPVAAPAHRSRSGTVLAVVVTVANVAVVAVFAPVAVAALRGHATPAGAIELASPFGAGRFVVVQGGDDPSINQHWPVRAQRHAIDVVAVNAAGFGLCARRTGTLEDHVAYGAPVVAPCTGTVRTARDDHPDRSGDGPAPTHVAGNHAVIACGDALVMLAHLAAGSVAVAPGDRVRVGDPIGAVGNSGNTTEPHPHLHVARHGSDPLADDARGVPFTIGGRFLLRGDRVPSPSR